MSTALIYARLSLDRAGDKLSVERQITWAHEEAERRGLEVVGVVTERDRSASKPGTRPGFAELMEAVARGGVAHVLAWRTDRLWRHVLDQQRFTVLASAAGLVSIITSEGELRVGDDDDDFMSALRALLGGRESKATSRRVAFYMEARATTGAPHSGGRRPFGYERDKVTPEPSESRAITEGYGRVLRGESLHSIAQDWTRSGLVTPTGKPLRGSDVSRLLRQPRYAGLRVHRGEILGPGTWEPLVDRETWDRVRVLLSGNRSAWPAVRPARVHLLAGLLVCGTCAEKLHGSAVRPGVIAYRCQDAHVSVVASQAHEEAVEALYVVVAEHEAEAPALTASHAQAATSGPVADALVALEGARARLAELEAAYADGDLSRAEYVRMRDRARERADKAEAELRNVPSAPGDLPGMDVLRSTWPVLTLEERRTVLRAVFRGFVVARVGRGQRGPRLVPVRVFNPGTV